MNPRLGIHGGISILGTTGIARPMSSKAYKVSLACQIDIAASRGWKELVFVPGNIGEKIEFISKPTVVNTVETEFGVSRLYKFTDHGNVIMWSTGKYLDPDI